MPLEPVAFITTEDGDDLIVSFALATGEPGEVRSLTLLRTPKYEPWLPEAERGVGVSDEAAGFDESAPMLDELQWEGDTVHLRCGTTSYALDVSDVEPREAAKARRILRAMNRDGRFELHLKTAH